MTLAHLLIKVSIPITIFEEEASPHVRGQGGTFDLHDGTRQKALKEIGLWEDLLVYARYDGEALDVADKTLKQYLDVGGTTEGTSPGRPETDREKLRKIFYEALPEGTIRWGARLRSVGEDRSLRFDHGLETGHDLIVGADGAWSEVRPLVSTVLPYNSGLGGIHAIINDAKKQHPRLYNLDNRVPGNGDTPVCKAVVRHVTSVGHHLNDLDHTLGLPSSWDVGALILAPLVAEIFMDGAPFWVIRFRERVHLDKPGGDRSDTVVQPMVNQ
ncbi:MAG: hypothetical protein Q9218_002763 [Villophora microphyllina]